jgi:hypothetical protein
MNPLCFFFYERGLVLSLAVVRNESIALCKEEQLTLALNLAHWKHGLHSKYTFQNWCHSPP